MALSLQRYTKHDDATVPCSDSNVERDKCGRNILKHGNIPASALLVHYAACSGMVSAIDDRDMCCAASKAQYGRKLLGQKRQRRLLR